VGEHRLGAPLCQRQAGDAGSAVGEHRVGDGEQCASTADRVVAESLDAQQASIGGEADLPQGGPVKAGYADWVVDE